MLTEYQQELIDYLKPKGYGWAKFASSVENQGWCSPKQEETMFKMRRTIRMRKAQPKKYSSGRTGRDDSYTISDAEAMKSGEYF